MEDQPLEDAELVERAQSGDIEAYEELVRRYQELAFRTAYLITRNAADAEDVAQEGFIKAHFALGRFRPGAPFRPWLLRIVANEARNRRKSAGRRAGLALKAAGAGASGEMTPSPEDIALAQEQRRTLLEAVNRLREEERLAIAYRYFLNLSEAELAEALGCPRGTVKSRLSRALGRLRTVLSGLAGGPASLPGREVADG
ncbi:MAG TPA: sigma-70 family RNA polymerase sigma factor [Dehalococcoidia bacterium]|nr:sigma-70 family RNA polymerase sigma factor [Dehalococcoidia bacterium]